MSIETNTSGSYYENMTRDDLRAECKVRGLRGYSRLTKPALIAALVSADEGQHHADMNTQRLADSTDYADVARAESNAEESAADTADNQTSAQIVTVTYPADIHPLTRREYVDQNGHRWVIARKRGSRVRWFNTVTARMEPWERAS